MDHGINGWGAVAHLEQLDGRLLQQACRLATTPHGHDILGDDPAELAAQARSRILSAIVLRPNPDCIKAVQSMSTTAMRSGLTGARE